MNLHTYIIIHKINRFSFDLIDFRHYQKHPLFPRSDEICMQTQKIMEVLCIQVQRKLMGATLTKGSPLPCLTVSGASQLAQESEGCCFGRRFSSGQSEIDRVGTLREKSIGSKHRIYQAEEFGSSTGFFLTRAVSQCETTCTSPTTLGRQRTFTSP